MKIKKIYDSIDQLNFRISIDERDCFFATLKIDNSKKAIEIIFSGIIDFKKQIEAIKLIKLKEREYAEFSYCITFYNKYCSSKERQEIEDLLQKEEIDIIWKTY